MFLLEKYLPKLDKDDSSSGIDDVPMPDTGNRDRDRDILNQDDDNEEESQEEGEEDSDEGGEEKPERKSGKAKRSNESELLDEENEDGEDDETSDSSEEDSDDEEESEGDSEDDEDSESEDEDVDDESLYRKLSKKYKGIFKDNPELRDLIKRDEEYSSVFSSPEVAKVSARKAEVFDAMRGDILSDKPENTQRFIDYVMKDKDGGANFAHNILDAIGKHSADLYGEVMQKPIKKALLALYHEGKKFGNKNMMASALHAHQYFFENTDILSPLPERSKPDGNNKEKQEWEKEKEDIQNQVSSAFTRNATEVIQHSLRSRIKKALEGYKLDDYTLRNITNDVARQVDQNLSEDKHHLAGMDSLFAQAKSAKFNEEWKTRIIKAYLTRATQALTPTVKKVLKEAGIKFKEVNKDTARRMVPSGLGGGDRSSGIDFKKVDKSKTTDMDILNDTPKYRK